MVSSSKRQRESLSGRIQLLIEAMDRLGVRLERASRGPSLSLGPTKRMFDASHNEAATATTPANINEGVPAWKSACKVRIRNGWHGIFSPTGKFWWADTTGSWEQTLPNMTAIGFVYLDNWTRAYANCDHCPPDWTEPVTAAEDVIDPHAAPVYRGPSTDDVENHLLCVVTPERSSYIRPTGKPGRYEQVWFDGSVTASPFSDGALRQCAVSKDWAMVYEPAARELVGLPALAELDHCREGGAL
jgi:hypothetical protein